MTASLTIAEQKERDLMLNLGLDPDAPRSSVGHLMLMEAGIGLDTIISVLNSSQREEAQMIVKVWGRLPQSDRDIVTFDTLIASARVAPADALGLVASEMYTQQASVATLIAAIATPEVMKATVEAARDPKFGHADRKMLLQASGNAPVPKSTTVITNIRDSKLIQNNTQVNVPSLGATAGMIDALDDVG